MGWIEIVSLLICGGVAIVLLARFADIDFGWPFDWDSDGGDGGD